MKKNFSLEDLIANLLTVAILITIAAFTQINVGNELVLVGTVSCILYIFATLTTGIWGGVITVVVSSAMLYPLIVLKHQGLWFLIPSIIPMLMVSDLVLILMTDYAKKTLTKYNENVKALISIAIGAVAKCIFSIVSICIIIFSKLYPSKNQIWASQKSGFVQLYSYGQLLIALAGGLVAFLLWLPLKKVYKKKI